MEEENQKRIKVVFLGDRAVGKSSIINRFLTNQFDHDIQTTLGVDFMSKNLMFQEQNYRIELWDTAGQEKYRSLVKGYLRGADACVFVYDCSNINSYVSLPQWIGLFDSVATPNTFRMMAGNKVDCEHDKQALEQTKDAMKQDNESLRNLPQIMTSAKLGVNIDQIVETILSRMTSQTKSEKLSVPLNRMIDDAKKWANSTCCK